MAHAAVNWVINDITYPDEVKPAARWLLVQIADRANKDDWSCFPSHKTLALDAGMSSRSVLTLLDVLETHSLIRRSARFRDNGTRSTDTITILRYAESSPPVDRPQPLQIDGAEVAALNHVTEPGKLDKGSRALASPDPFDAWWEVYPRKAAKKEARKAWAQMTSEIATLTLAELMIRTSAYAEAMINKDPERIAHPATWLRGERWTDELPSPRSQTDGSNARYPTAADRGAERHRSVLTPMVEGAREALNRRRRWTLGS